MARASRRSLAALAALLLLAFGGAAHAAPRGGAYATQLERTVAYLQLHQNADGGFGGRPGGESDDSMTDDVAFALAAFGVNPRDQARPGGTDVYRFMTSPGPVAALDVTTDFDRALLVSNTACADPRDFGGVDLVGELTRRQLADGSLPHEAGGTQGGVNDTAFALLGLVLVEEPDLDARLERMADWIERAQRADGAWGLTLRGQGASTDMTGAALQALAAVGRTTGPPVDRALALLRARQNDDGGWSQLRRGAVSNTMSTAWVVQGLVAVGQDPATWDAAAADPLEYLDGMQRPDGSVRYSADDQYDTPLWTTAQVAPAFAGQPLPIGCVERETTPPDPPDPGGEPATQVPSGVGGDGQGGTGLDEGDGVAAGGGGSGAPAFSRPRPQSRGRTAGGIREITPTPTPDPATATPTSTPEPGRPSPDADPSGIARSNGEADAGVTPERVGRGGGRNGLPIPSQAMSNPGTGGSVTGTLISRDGAAGDGDGTAAAPGLLAAKAGDPVSPVPALVLAGFLAACALGGWRQEGVR